MDTRVYHPDRLRFIEFYVIAITLGAFSMLSGEFAVVLVALAAIMILLAEILRSAETFTVNEHGVERGFQFVSTHKVFASFDRIQDVSVRQNILERIFGLGTLSLNTAGGPHEEVKFRGVRNPHQVEELIRARIHAEPVKGV